MRPAWSRCVMTSFCCITGTTKFILFPNMSLNRLGFAMLTVGTDIVHWAYCKTWSGVEWSGVDL